MSKTENTNRFFSPHILYVDDNQDSCEMIGLMLGLANENYRVSTAVTAQEALALIKTEPVDLLILDNILPEMTGVELCRMIREKNSQLPIMFYSAMARKIDREKAMAAGANEYLVKPNDLDRFETIVGQMIQNDYKLIINQVFGTQ